MSMDEMPITAAEYRDRINNKRWQEIFGLRLKGETIIAIGQKYGVSKERVRQLLAYLVRKAPPLVESQYVYWYRKYDLPKEAFMFIFEVDESSYNFLHMVGKRGKESMEELQADPNLNAEQRERVSAFLHRGDLMIDGEFVAPTFEGITRYLLKKNHCKSPVSGAVFAAEYFRFCEEHGLHKESSTTRAVIERIRRTKYAVETGGNSFRYFDMNKARMKTFLQNLDFNSFMDMEISTKLLAEAQPDLMRGYNVRDYHELHNIFRKNQDMLPENVKVKHMPLITVGAADREKQVIDFFKNTTAKSYTEAAKMYEERYGMDWKSVLTGMFTPTIKRSFRDRIAG